VYVLTWDFFRPAVLMFVGLSETLYEDKKIFDEHLHNKDICSSFLYVCVKVSSLSSLPLAFLRWTKLHWMHVCLS
jgi:hypothetical protein